MAKNDHGGVMKRLIAIAIIALLQSACASTTASPSQELPMITYEQIGAEIVISHSDESSARIASN
jgi:hypothetical protein